MRHIISFIGTALIIALQSAVISAVFCTLQWLVSLTTVCSPPTWERFFYGAVALFIILFIHYAYITAASMYHYKKDPVYREVCAKTGITWKDYKKRILPLQTLAQTYPMDFRLFVENEEGWQTYDMGHDGKDCIMLIPNPQVTTSYYYYIKFTGPIDEKDAIRFLTRFFLKYINEREGL